MQLEYTVPSTIPIPDRLTSHVWEGLENFNEVKIAILGICEYRGHAANSGCEAAPDAIRRQLYKLKSWPNINIADAGNIILGDTYKDSLFALEKTLHRLLEHRIIPIIIGGDQTMLQAHEQAYHKLYFPFINLLQVDEYFNLNTGDDEDPVDRENYLGRLLTKEPNLVFNFIQMGHQSYFTDSETLEIAARMDFEVHRLGSVREDMTEVEPIVRDCDLLAFNTAALCAADAPGINAVSPNGFTAEEACRIVRYAGLSDRLTSIGFYDYNPQYDERNRTAQVIAQAIWYFIQGVSNRKLDYPILDEKNFNKYIVSSPEIGHDITFLRSKKSERWWIRIPDDHLKYESHKLFPCSYKDYQLALKEEIPARWWKAYNRML